MRRRLRNGDGNEKGGPHRCSPPSAYSILRIQFSLTAAAAAAVATAATTAAAIAAAASTAAAATTATFLGLGFIDGQGASAMILATQCRDGRLGLAFAAHFDKAKAF